MNTIGFPLVSELQIDCFPGDIFCLQQCATDMVFFFPSLCNLMKIIFQQTLLHLEKMGRYWSKGTDFHLSWMWSGYLMYNMVTIVTRNLQENIYRCLCHIHTYTRTYTHRKLCEVMDLLVTLVLVIISQWIHMSKHHINDTGDLAM